MYPTTTKTELDLLLYQYTDDYQKIFGRPNTDIAQYKPDSYSVKQRKLNMCPFSKVVWNHIPALMKRVPIVVPCRKCAFCLHRKQNALIFRVFMHSKAYVNSLFVTLTYNDEHYPPHVSCCKRDLQLFLKRLRKNLGKNSKFTYFATCERGKKSGRLHFHILFFWNTDETPSGFRRNIKKAWMSPKRCFTDFQSYFDFLRDYGSSNLSISSNGFSYFGTVQAESIAYCTKYSVKDIGSNCVFMTWSKKLGYDILATDDYMRECLKHSNFVTYYINPEKCYTIPVPRYYREKLLSMVERACLTREFFDSEVFRDRLRAVNDFDVMSHYLSLYDSYKEKSKCRQEVLDYKRKLKHTLL